MTDLDPRPDNAYNILSLDPGTETLGHGLIQVDCADGKIIGAEAWTVRASKLPMLLDWHASLYQERFARIQALKKSLRQTLDTYEPQIVACETPFFNRLRPNAFEALLEVLSAIKDTVYEWNPFLQIAFVTPSAAKKNLNVSGKSGDKDLVINAILSHEIFGKMKLQGIDEHSADALAIGYYRYCHKPEPN
jgi:Holliday junction resolvasome RuvABC endonuclease subunit